MKICLKETSKVCTSNVRPAQETSNERLWLSNLDLVQGRVHLPTVYFYKLPESSSIKNFFDTCVLKEALSKALVSFYPLAGRLGRDGNGRVELNCNGEGVLFVEAQTDSAMNQLVESLPSKDIGYLFSSAPSFTVTRFTCGGVCIGIGFNHTVADGISALHFINSWSDIARGICITISPVFDRTFLCARFPPNPTFDHIECHPNPTLRSSNQHQHPESGPKPSCTADMKITKDQLHSLKSMAKDIDSSTKYSTYEVLTAHIWRCACKARALLDDQETRLAISVDGRSRFHPPLPPGYFGNVVFHCAPIGLSGEIVSEPFLETVKRIRRALKRMDDEYLRSAIDFLEQLPDITQAMPKACPCPNVKIVSWTRMAFYDADFGWGKPLYTWAINKAEGKGHIVPSPTSDGSLYLVVCLEIDHMQTFQKLFYDF